MDIEQMRIRMGEMAAEIERLQSVIDEANAQPSCAECGNGDQGLALYCVKCIDTIQQSPGLNFTVMQALATLKTEVLGLESPVYAIQLIERIEAEQQSPAVAVPDGLRELIAACRQIGFPVVTEGMRYVIDDMQSALTRVQNSIGAASPSITEQDAREIGLSAFRHMSQYGGRTLETWLEEAGRALLDNLNDKSESVGG